MIWNKRKLITLILITASASCSHGTNVEVSTNDTEKNSIIQCVDKTDPALEQILGCNCSLYITGKNPSCKKEVFIREWGEKLKVGKSRGWFNIGGQNKPWRLKKFEGEDFSGKSWREFYSSGLLEVIIDLQGTEADCGEFNSSCELFDIEGTLSIKSNGITKQIISVHGECGC